MAIYLGDKKLKDLQIGDSLVDYVYQGSELVWRRIPMHYEYATDEDFEKEIRDNGKIIYRYVGSKPYVILPEQIQGDSDYEIESMFERTSIKGVAGKAKGSAFIAFNYCTSDTIDVSYLDTSKVTSMQEMFQRTEVLNEIIGLENFNTSNVTDMRHMFNYSNVTSLDVSSFDTSNVTDMSYMFQRTKATTINLSSFNTSEVTNMKSMFINSEVTSIIGLENFNTSNVTDMSHMFRGTKIKSLDLRNFNTSNVDTMHAMFRENELIDLNVTSFDTSKTTNLGFMFTDSKLPIIDLSSFDMSNKENIASMFRGALATKGYARTKADADILNNTTNKPSQLTFIVK